MKYEAKRTWAEIDIDALKHNIEVIKKHVAPGAEIMGVVKADACGHGAVSVAKELLKEGVNFFAVSMLDEAVELRNAGIQSPILILSDNEPECAETIVELDIRQGVYQLEVVDVVVVYPAHLVKYMVELLGNSLKLWQLTFFYT